MLVCWRAQAIALGQALVDGRWLDCVTHHDQLFRDEYALYRPLQVTVHFWYVNAAHTGKETFQITSDALQNHFLLLATKQHKFDTSHINIDWLSEVLW